MYVTSTYTVGESLYCGTGANAGKLQNAGIAATGTIVGIVTKVPGAYDSGVPGIDVESGSITLGNYMEFILKL
jgi:hypothetical protein